MSKMKLGTKIIVGFCLLILITLLLGTLAIYNMKGVEGDSVQLATEFIPEVDIATEIQGAANRLMYEMRGYSMSENITYYEGAQTELAALETALGRADDLAGRAKHLTKLKSEIESIRNALNEYRQAMKDTRSTIERLTTSLDNMVKEANAYVDLCTQYLDGQKAGFNQELEERQRKIRLVEELTLIGTQSRVLNFKAQATNDTDLLAEAIANLDKVDKVTAELRRITRDKDDLLLIDASMTAARNYQAAIREFLAEFRKGVVADPNILARARNIMDENAAVYTNDTSKFFKGQQQKLEQDMTSRNFKMSLANEVIILGKDTRVETLRMLAFDKPELAKGALDSFPKIDEKLEELKKLSTGDQNLRHLEEVKKTAGEYKTGLLSVISDSEKIVALDQKRNQLGDAMIDACINLADAGLKNTNQIADNAMNNLSLSSMVMVIGLIVALVLGVVLALVITRSITKPINNVIDGLSTGADQVASASEQVSSASQQLAEGSSEQAAAVEETSSSLEEMASMTKQNADNATHANSLMTETKHTVDRAGHSMKDMSQAMNEIATSGQEISKIIKTIDEIAFQTNLLALNAAVEAARAGEAGQGFAVVADEVRNLAQRAAEAAKNTSGLIEDTINKIDTGNQLVRSTGEAFTEVESNAGKVAELVGEIAAASQEQSQGIEQISRAMSQMDQVTQQNAANAEESASAAEELNAQSESMKDVVNDLITMVGGQLIDTTRKVRTPVKKAIAPPSRTLAAGPKQEKPKRKEVSADQLIPMDDDFSDF